MAQTSLNSTGVASSAALSLQSNGTTEAIGISTGQVATLAQNPILTSGTANGVAFLNGSKVLTTGSALVFDGTNLVIGAATSSPTNNNAVWVSPASSTTRFTNTGAAGKEWAIGTSAPGVQAVGDYFAFTRYNGTSWAELGRFDSAGNLGLGVTPSAWTDTKAMQLGQAASVFGGSAQIGAYVGSNVYYNAGWKYITTGLSTKYEQNESNSGAHKWWVAGTGTAGNAISFTQAMTLDASGYLLVGATSSNGAGAHRLQVGQSQPTAQILIKNSSGHGALYSTGTDLYQSWTTGGFLALGNAPTDGSSFTERARIDSSGNLLVGTTSTGSGAKVAFLYNGGSGSNGLMVAESSGQSGATFAIFTTGGVSGTNIGTITRVGATNAVTYNSLSDYRLKTVIGPVADAGQRIDALEPVEYEWKTDGSRTRGFLAHQFQEVYAASVSGTKDAVDAEGKPVYQSMQASSSEVIADLVAEIQSLRQRVASLEA